jgi:hypothetical protein
MSAAHHLVAGNRVANAPVFAADGRKLGKIAEILIDKPSGKVAYALMAYDGFLGMGDRYYPLPWVMLDYDPARRGFVTPLTREQVEAGHHVADEEVENEIEWREALHAHYGVAPYWPPVL